jgi:hypothetical protein
MGVWIVSVVVSWLAGAAMVYALVQLRQLTPHVPPDWRNVAAVASGLHIAASAIAYEPFVRALQWRVSRGTMCALTGVLGALPWAALLVWRAGGLDAALAFRHQPEAWVCAAFFIVTAGGFGLLRHERDPRIAALEARLAAIEKPAPRL